MNDMGRQEERTAHLKVLSIGKDRSTLTMITTGTMNGLSAEVINDSGAEANVMSVTLAVSVMGSIQE